MSKRKYTNEPIGKIKIIEDFLPPPEELVLKDDTVKVTLHLSKRSLKYFKSEAEKYDAHFQTMIRVLLDKYTENCEAGHRRHAAGS